MSHQKTASHETTSGNQRWQLQIGQAHDRMTRSATARVPSAKTNQKTTDDHQHETAQRRQTRPRKKVSRQQTAGVLNTRRGKVGCQIWMDFDRCRVRQPNGRNDCADCDASDEKQIPDFFSPVVLKKRNFSGQTSRANVAQAGRNAKMAVAQNQQCRHDQPD